MTYVDQLEGTDKIELIETLREVTDGKVKRLSRSSRRSAI